MLRKGPKQKPICYKNTKKNGEKYKKKARSTNKRPKRRNKKTRLNNIIKLSNALIQCLYEL